MFVYFTSAYKVSNGDGRAAMDSREKAVAMLKAHSKILLDLHQALQLLQEIVDPEDRNAERLANEAKLTAAIIGYARSFTTSKGGSFYSIGELKRHPSFDPSIHNHLLKMRDKLLAHADEDVFPTGIAIYTVDVKTDILQTLAFSVMGVVHRFSHFKDEGFKSRLIVHLTACLIVVDAVWSRDAEAYLRLLNSKELAVRSEQSEGGPWAAVFDLAAPSAAEMQGRWQNIPWSNSPKLTFSDAYLFRTVTFMKQLEAIKAWLASGDSVELRLNAKLQFSNQSGQSWDDPR